MPTYAINVTEGISPQIARKLRNIRDAAGAASLTVKQLQADLNITVPGGLANSFNAQSISQDRVRQSAIQLAIAENNLVVAANNAIVSMNKLNAANLALQASQNLTSASAAAQATSFNVTAIASTSLSASQQRAALAANQLVISNNKVRVSNIQVQIATETLIAVKNRNIFAIDREARASARHIISLANETRAVERHAITLAREGRARDNHTSKIIRETAAIKGQTSAQAGLFASSLQTLRIVRLLAGVTTIAFAAQGLGAIADNFQTVENQIGSVTDTVGQEMAVLSELTRIANETGVGIGALTNDFIRFEKALALRGASRAEVLDFTETLTKVLASAGKTAQEITSTLTQLGQALTKGNLDGEELRSLRENAPINVMVELARVLGVNIGQLKDLGQEGKITTDAIRTAFKNLAEPARIGFDKLEPTIQRSFFRLGNAFTAFFSEVERSTRIFSGFANSVSFVAANLNSILTAIKTITLAYVGYRIALLANRIALAINAQAELTLGKAIAAKTSFTRLATTATAANTVVTATAITTSQRFAAALALAGGAIVSFIPAAIAIGLAALVTYRDDIKLVSEETVSFADVTKKNALEISEGFVRIKDLDSLRTVGNDIIAVKNEAISLGTFLRGNADDIASFFDGIRIGPIDTSGARQSVTEFFQSIGENFTSLPDRFVAGLRGIGQSLITAVQVIFVSFLKLISDSIIGIFRDINRLVVTSVISANNVLKSNVLTSPLAFSDSAINTLAGVGIKVETSLTTAAVASEAAFKLAFSNIEKDANTQFKKIADELTIAVDFNREKLQNIENEKAAKIFQDQKALLEEIEKLEEKRIDTIGNQNTELNTQKNLLEGITNFSQTVFDQQNENPITSRSTQAFELQNKGFQIAEDNAESYFRTLSAGYAAALDRASEFSKAVAGNITSAGEGLGRGLAGQKEGFAQFFQQIFASIINARNERVQFGIASAARPPGSTKRQSESEEGAKFAALQEAAAASGPDVEYVNGLLENTNRQLNEIVLSSLGLQNLIPENATQQVQALNNALQTALIHGTSLPTPFVKLGESLMKSGELSTALQAKFLEATTGITTGATESFTAIAGIGESANTSASAVSNLVNTSIADLGRLTAAANAAAAAVNSIGGGGLGPGRGSFGIDGFGGGLFPTFGRGGFTGSGPRDRIAGTVEGQEFVVNARATRRHRALLEALNSGRSTPTPRSNGSGGSSSGGMRVTIQNFGSSNVQTKQISPEEMLIIIDQRATQAAMNAAPVAIANQLRNPNSRVSKSLSRNTTSTRRR